VGKKITTIEGLANGEHLDPVQQAFLEAEAFQCGYCTPGMILSAVALLRKSKAKLTDKETIAHMNGNICRCGTYGRILEAIHAAANMSRSTVDAKR
jgi:aerobic-type carbon monoxide dehydrogenase small subunit (CoxS/CutS family)